MQTRADAAVVACTQRAVLPELWPEAGYRPPVRMEQTEAR